MATHHFHSIAHLVTAGLVAGALAAPAAIAQPIADPQTHREHGASTAPQSITFTNPLGRSRGPGAGGGLL